MVYLLSYQKHQCGYISEVLRMEDVGIGMLWLNLDKWEILGSLSIIWYILPRQIWQLCTKWWSELWSMHFMRHHPCFYWDETAPRASQTTSLFIHRFLMKPSLSIHRFLMKAPFGVLRSKGFLSSEFPNCTSKPIKARSFVVRKKITVSFETV
jgi:hypothetical protein